MTEETKTPKNTQPISGLEKRKANLLPGGVKGHKGRRDFRIFRDRVRKALAERDPVTQQKALDRIIHAQVKRALEGDTAAFRELADRVDGKVSNQADQSSKISIVFRNLVDNPHVIIDGQAEPADEQAGISPDYIPIESDS